MPQTKAQRAAPTLGALGDAGLGHLGASLRARREAGIRGVAPLTNGITIGCTTRLAAAGFSSR